MANQIFQSLPGSGGGSGQVTVIAGAAPLYFPPGREVSWYRSMASEGTPIASDAVARVNNAEVSPSRIMSAGETLIFVRNTGQKG